MSTLLITTPGMGKTYLVKEMKRNGILALDFDVKGSKPSNDSMWDAARSANTAYVNAAFEAGYEFITTWPGSINLHDLDRSVEVLIITPVGNAWTGCMLRIAARQPGTPFIDDIASRYHDLVDSLESDYLDAISFGFTARRVIVDKAYDNLSIIWRSINTIGYDGGLFLDVEPTYTPVSAIEHTLPRADKIAASEVFHNCLTPDLVSDITFEIDQKGVIPFYCDSYGFGMFAHCKLARIGDFISPGATVHRISNTCGNYYVIYYEMLVGIDEMGDWCKKRYSYVKCN